MLVIGLACRRARAFRPLGLLLLARAPFPVTPSFGPAVPRRARPCLRALDIHANGLPLLPHGCLRPVPCLPPSQPPRHAARRGGKSQEPQAAAAPTLHFSGRQLHLESAVRRRVRATKVLLWRGRGHPGSHFLRTPRRAPRANTSKVKQLNDGNWTNFAPKMLAPLTHYSTHYFG